MDFLQVGREIGTTLATANLRAEVTDLLNQKVALLTAELTRIKAENAELKETIVDLTSRVPQTKEPPDPLTSENRKVLKAIIESSGGETNVHSLIRQLNLPEASIRAHLAMLRKAQMITVVRFHPSERIKPRDAAFMTYLGD